MNLTKTIMVTGGAGFIGSALIRYIINNTDYAVVNVDKLTYSGNLDSLESIDQNNRYVFEQVDICDGTSLERVIFKNNPKLIIHLAAESHVDRSIDSPKSFIESNIVGTFTLLEQSRKYWQSLKGQQKDDFALFTYQLMKFMGTLRCHLNFLLRKLDITRVRLILHQRQVQITLLGLGIEPMDCLY